MKTILSAIFTVALVSVLVGAGTFAYYTDTEISSDNTFTADEMDLVTKDTIGDPWTNGVTATWTIDNMVPGDHTYGYVQLEKVDDSFDADHMEIKCDYFVTEEEPRISSDTDPNTDTNPDSMAKQLVILIATYDNGGNVDLLTGIKTYGTDELPVNNDWKIADQDVDGKITLYDFKNSNLDNLQAPNGHMTTFKMDVKFDENAGNDFQGDTLDMTVTFTLNQDVSQSQTPP